MKANFLIFLLFLSACQWLNSYPDTAEEVTLRFRKAILNGNFKQARQYCDETNANFLSVMEGMYDMSSEESKKQNKDLAKTLTLAECRYNPERTKARCTVCCNGNNDIFADATGLVFKEGYWQVLVGKLGEDSFDDSELETPSAE